MGHTIADIIFVAVGLLIVIFSAKRGFFRTLMKFAKIFLAIGAAYLFGNMLGPWLAETVPALGSTFSVVLSYVVVFVGSLVLLTVATWFVGALIERVVLVRALDSILGGAVGLIIAVMALFVAASVMKHLPASQEIYAQSTVVKFFGDSSFLDSIRFLDVGRAWFADLIG